MSALLPIIEGRFDCNPNVHGSPPRKELTLAQAATTTTPTFCPLPAVGHDNQSLVIDRFHTSNTQSATYDEVPVDGLVEIWFTDATAAKRALDTQIVIDAIAHAREFLAEVTPLVVTTRSIL